MPPLSTTALGLALLLASATTAHAGPQGIIKANGVACATQAGIEAARPDMNPKQLESLRCVNVATDLRVDVLPPTSSCDSYLFVAATLPDKIMRYWIRRDELSDYELQLADAGITCQELTVPNAKTVSRP